MAYGGRVSNPAPLETHVMTVVTEVSLLFALCNGALRKVAEPSVAQVDESPKFDHGKPTALSMSWGYG